GGALVFDAVALHAKLLDLGGARLVRFLYLRRVLALPLGLSNGVAGRVLLALQPFQLGDDAAPGRLERHNLLKQLIGIEAAPAQPRAHLIDVIADVGRVEHDLDILTWGSAPHRNPPTPRPRWGPAPRPGQMTTSPVFGSRVAALLCY